MRNRCQNCQKVAKNCQKIHKMAKSCQNISPNAKMHIFTHSEKNLQQDDMLHDYIWAISYFCQKFTF